MGGAPCADLRARGRSRWCAQVFNAKDACAKLGVDGMGLDKKWSQLQKDKDLIKFGGGFYCGKVAAAAAALAIHLACRWLMLCVLTRTSQALAQIDVVRAPHQVDAVTVQQMRESLMVCSTEQTKNTW